MSNEGDIHGNGDDIADNEQRIKISNAILPYLEHLHKLLLDPPYVRKQFPTFFYIKILFIFLNTIYIYTYNVYMYMDYLCRNIIISRIVYFILHFKNHQISVAQKPAVKTTIGLLDCPLGNTRLHVAKLLSALLSTENLKIHESLANLGTFQTLLVRLHYKLMF